MGRPTGQHPGECDAHPVYQAGMEWGRVAWGDGEPRQTPPVVTVVVDGTTEQSLVRIV